MFTFVEDEAAIRTSMIVCLISQGFALIAEILKMRTLKNEYFMEFYHYIELIQIGIFSFYFWLRFFFSFSMLPEDYVHHVNGKDGKPQDELNILKMEYDGVTYAKMTYFAVLNVFLYASVGLKLMSFMRLQPKLGQLELLIGQCIYDCIPFAVFYMAWTYLFARFNEILGVNSEKDQFIDLDKVFRYYF